MRKAIFTTLSILVLFLFAACNNRAKDNAQLATTDYLNSQQPNKPTISTYRQPFYAILTTIFIENLSIAIFKFHHWKGRCLPYAANTCPTIEHRKEQFKQSDIYKKMRSIIQCHKDGIPAEMMHKNDWLQLVAETDRHWNNITQTLQSQYGLTENEIHLCCLCLTDLHVSHFGQILNCTRDNIYKKADRILEQRMGFAHKEVSLKEVLIRLIQNKPASRDIHK